MIRACLISAFEVREPAGQAVHEAVGYGLTGSGVVDGVTGGCLANRSTRGRFASHVFKGQYSNVLFGMLEPSRHPLAQWWKKREGR